MAVQSTPRRLVGDLDDARPRARASRRRRGGLSRTAAAHPHPARSAPGPTRLTELAAAEGVSQPSMSALVARLADAGAGAARRRPAATPARCVLAPHPRRRATCWRSAATPAPQRLAPALAGLSADDVARIADALPALARLADALRRSSTHPEVTR